MRPASGFLWLGLCAVGGALIADPASAITLGAPFAPLGTGGSVHGQTISVGSGGEIFETQAFLNVAGLDLNGGAIGTSAQLDLDSLAASGLSVGFGASLQDGNSDLLMSWQITNTTSSALDVTFLHFVDAEIDETLNTFFNETASTSGTPAAGQGFEVDEPGFVFGDVFDNLLAGSLDGINIFPPAEDVAMALSFALGPLAGGASAVVDVMVSEDGDFLGPFAITHTDTDPGSPTAITYSGAVRSGPGPAVPEPMAALAFALGAAVVGLAVRRRRS